MDNDDDDMDMLDGPVLSPSLPVTGQTQINSRPHAGPHGSLPTLGATAAVVSNGFPNSHSLSLPPVEDSHAILNTQQLTQPSREASVLAFDTSHLSIDQSLKPTSDQIDSFLSDLELDDHETRAPFVSELPTGFCYDVRMRYHCELEIAKDRRDYHPEDPRRIFEIYRELCVAGLIEDKFLTTGPLVSRPLQQIDVREVTEGEVELVHDPKHWYTMKETPSKTLFHPLERCDHSLIEQK